MQTCNYLRPGNAPNLFHLRSSIFDEWDRTCDALRHLFWSGLVWQRPEHHDLFPKKHNQKITRSYKHQKCDCVGMNNLWTGLLSAVSPGEENCSNFSKEFFFTNSLVFNQSRLVQVHTSVLFYIGHAQHSARRTKVVRRKFRSGP